MTHDELAAMVRTLADRQALKDLIYRYCRAMDRCDAELGYSLWHDDSRADYGSLFRGSGRDFIDFALRLHRETFITHSHQITNIGMTLDGDRAVSESYVTTALRYRNGEQLVQTTGRGRYLDRWSRRSGRWALDERRYVHDLDDTRGIDAWMAEGEGRRDVSDASYDYLLPKDFS
ncbi:MAG: hypothetical protein JWQ90_3859 [Hydrocarboniphaga sp.]|uniref:nuclear transport factor 2 family protein n=1 Tax=Hydrocarboniphaga sp. TaxID=2033016 RepID=UPI00262D9BB6|nr:nuclear transport factor 2 family protein [Hydrocarboniphaga sp.]MDB5971409.1 hypothetical protein [Hydrocarboniphaga sp.]